MPNEEWGVKRICPTTGKRFFDMNKKPIISPYTGETVTLDANTRTRVAVAEKPAEVLEPKVKDSEDILLEEEESSGNGATDNDLLDDDDDNDNVSLDEIKDVPADDDA